MTDLMTRAMSTQNRFAQLLRNTAIPMFARLAPIQHAFVERLSELGITYGGSPIVEGDGERYFDDTVRGGNRIGSRFLLVVGKDAAAAARDAAAALCAESLAVVELREGAGEGLMLVRPDGYVAATVSSADAARGFKTLRTLLESQVTP
jgi:hypothetical protein